MPRRIEAPDIPKSYRETFPKVGDLGAPTLRSFVRVPTESGYPKVASQSQSHKRPEYETPFAPARPNEWLRSGGLACSRF